MTYEDTRRTDEKIITVICLVILVFSVCKETPSNEIVINRGLSEFDDKLAAVDSESIPDKLFINISKYERRDEIILTGKQKERFSLLTVNAVDGTVIYGG